MWIPVHVLPRGAAPSGLALWVSLGLVLFLLVRLEMLPIYKPASASFYFTLSALQRRDYREFFKYSK